MHHISITVEQCMIIYIYDIYTYITKKTFIIFILLYFRILVDSFVRLTENLKLYNYMKLKSIA